MNSPQGEKVDAVGTDLTETIMRVVETLASRRTQGRRRSEWKGNIKTEADAVVAWAATADAQSG